MTPEDAARLAEIERHWFDGKAEDGFGFWPHRSAAEDLRFFKRILDEVEAKLSAVTLDYTDTVECLNYERSMAMQRIATAQSARERALTEAAPVIDAARAYRQAELDGTPRMWRGKQLQDLATALDEALDAFALIPTIVLRAARSEEPK